MRAVGRGSRHAVYGDFLLLKDYAPESVCEMIAGFALGLELVGALTLAFRKFS